MPAGGACRGGSDGGPAAGACVPGAAILCEPTGTDMLSPVRAVALLLRGRGRRCMSRPAPTTRRAACCCGLPACRQATVRACRHRLPDDCGCAGVGACGRRWRCRSMRRCRRGCGSRGDWETDRRLSRPVARCGVRSDRHCGADNQPGSAEDDGAERIFGREVTDQRPPCRPIRRIMPARPSIPDSITIRPVGSGALLGM